MKCDLVQPNCRRCQQADLKCSGYGLELYWITGAERVAASAIKRRARKVTFPGWQFDLNAVDAQLADIDDLPIGNILDGQSRGAFAVFRGDNTDAFESICISNQLPQECTDTHSETPYESIEDFEATESVLEKSTTELADPAQNADELGLMPLVRQSRLTTALPHLPLYMNFGRTCFDDPLISSLLSHYINDVCVLLTPLDHPNNPYSSIHFPKALVGATELDPSWSYTSHSTSSTSIAVFYAVMATAAFHLSSKNGPDSRALYLTGRSYRAKALSSIRKALQSSLGPDRGTPLTIQQCEAILSAMFALVTLDVRCLADPDNMRSRLLGCGRVDERVLDSPGRYRPNAPKMANRISRNRPTHEHTFVSYHCCQKYVNASIHRLLVWYGRASHASSRFHLDLGWTDLHIWYK